MRSRHLFSSPEVISVPQIARDPPLNLERGASRQPRRPRLLVAYSNAATHVATTVEYLASFAKHSCWEVSYLHVTDGAEVDLDLNQFDAVFHSYCARLCFPHYVSPSYLAALKRFRGVRVLAVQDEYDR